MIKSSRLRLCRREKISSIIRKGSFNSFRCQKKKIKIVYSYQGGCFRYECTPRRKEGGLVINTSNLGDVYFLNVSYKKLLSKLWEPDYFWLIVLMKKCNNIDLMFILLLEHIYLQLNLLSKARKAILWLSL